MHVKPVLANLLLLIDFLPKADNTIPNTDTIQLKNGTNNNTKSTIPKTYPIIANALQGPLGSLQASTTVGCWLVTSITSTSITSYS